MNEAHPTLSWALAAREAPELEALRWADSIWSFSSLWPLIESTAAGLRALGAGPGAAVAVQAPNGLRALLTSAAAIELGAPLLPIHPRLTQAEAQVLLDDARPAVLVRGDEASALPSPAAFAQTTAVVMYTSGTSGKPRGAILSRRALVAAARASEARLGMAPHDRWLLCLPLCHIGGLSILTRCLLGRACVVLAASHHEALALIERHRPSLLSVVPTSLRALLDADARGALAGLRAVLVGGAAAAPSLLAECARRRVPAITTYGLTEACSQVTTQPPRDPSTTEAGSGLPLPGVEVQIRDDEGRGLPAGSVGKIHVRGPAMMDGYLGHAPLVGWFDTGDLGALDERGALHVCDRRGDLIVTGGENVYPTEIEQALLTVEGVRAAMVFGVPDERWGQLVAAALVVDAAFDEPALRASIASRLASHKWPRRYCLVDELPLGSTGKPLRRQALARFASSLRELPR